MQRSGFTRKGVKCRFNENMWKNSAYSDDFKQKALGFEAGSSHIFFFILLSIIWSTRISYGHRELTHWKVEKSAQTRTILYLLSLH